jgi:hypothetical protein
MRVFDMCVEPGLTSVLPNKRAQDKGTLRQDIIYSAHYIASALCPWRGRLQIHPNNIGCVNTEIWSTYL